MAVKQLFQTSNLKQAVKLNALWIQCSHILNKTKMVRVSQSGKAIECTVMKPVAGRSKLKLHLRSVFQGFKMSSHCLVHWWRTTSQYLKFLKNMSLISYLPFYFQYVEEKHIISEEYAK